MSDPVVDVIIVNWNGREQTLACLEALEPQRSDVSGTVITVVDNGSTDGSIAAITSWFRHVRFIPLGRNRGFTGGIAAGLATSRARHVVFLNNDAVPEPGWLAAIVAASESAPADVVSVGGRIVDLSGALIDFIGGALTFDGHAFQNGFRMPLGARSEPAPGEEILFACGGNMISRRELLMELGAFDDDFFAYLEDVDLGWRTWLSGHRVLFEPRALVRHASSATSDRLGNYERGVLFERNALQTAIKNYEDEAFAGPVFFTYLSRLHHYATTRNAGASELTRTALGEESPDGFWSRASRRIFGRKPIVTIDDPLTVMQFRAFDWIVRHQERLVTKRRQVQALRRRGDAEIFGKFPLLIVPTYPGDDALMASAMFRLLRPQLPAVERKLGDIIRT